MNFLYYDMEGVGHEIDHDNPEDRALLTKLFDHEYRRVAQDYVGDVHVSTVLLAIDHSWEEGPPIIFETMVFGYGEGDEEYQWRYSTKEAALAGHALILGSVRSGTLTQEILDEGGDDDVG